MPTAMKLLIIKLSLTIFVAIGFNISAYAADCTVTSAVLNFGAYDATSSVSNQSPGLVRVSCTKDASPVPERVPFTLQLLSSAKGTVGSRKLDSGASALSFDIYTDLLRTRPWGDGTNGTYTLSGVVVLPAPHATVVVEFPVYGRIPAKLASRAGSYSGLFTVLLNY